MARVDRRKFLKLVGAGGAGAGAGFMLAESIKDPVEFLLPYTVPPEEYSPGIATWYNSVCGMCSAGCGITVRTREGRAKKIEGNPSHPVNQGRLCALGQAGLQALYNPDRFDGPLTRVGERGSGSFRRITWDEGLSQVAGRIAELRDAGRADGVRILSKPLRGHSAELMERFMNGIGSTALLYYDFAHPATLYAANRRLFGQERLPYYDIANAGLLLSFGADFLTSWLSPVHFGLGYGQLRQGQRNSRGRVVQIEPRMSLTGAAADQWLPARPGSEGVLALGIARRVLEQGGYDGDDADRWQAALAPYSAAYVAAQCDLAAATVDALGEEFAQAGAPLAIGGGAAANQSNGVETLVAVNVLNHLAGNVGKAGGVVFNPDPVAGRSALARHADYEQMTALADSANRGEVEVLIVDGANPLFTLPDAAGFAESLSEIPLIVSLSSFPDETALEADIVLPGHTYLESWGDDVPEPGVGFQVAAVSQPVVAPLYDTRATGDIVLGLARRLGLDDDFPWNDTQAFIRDRWRRIFERSQPQEGAASFTAFWRELLKSGVWGENRRADPAAFALPSAAIETLAASAAEFAGGEEDYPFVLHPYLSPAMHDGRGANLPWMQELPDPITSIVYGSWVEMNPETAAESGLREGDLVEIHSPHGSLEAPLVLFPAIRPDVLAMPVGQGHRAFGRYAEDRGANPLRILAPQTDRDAGSHAWAATRVSVVATGRRADLVKTSGLPRDLGRSIIRTTGPSADADHSASLSSIPVTVEKSS